MFILHPLALYLEYLLQHITYAALTAIIWRYILAERLYLLACVGRASGQSALAHDLPIGDVITHIENLFGLEVILLNKMVEIVELDA